MKTSFIFLLTAACSLAALLSLNPATARAEFYKYKDSDGNLIITNRLEDVPKKYRRNVKVVWDDELTARDPLARRAAAAEARRAQQQRPQAQQQTQQQEKQGAAGKLQSSDGKRLVITFDEETGQLIRTME